MAPLAKGSTAGVWAFDEPLKGWAFVMQELPRDAGFRYGHKQYEMRFTPDRELGENDVIHFSGIEFGPAAPHMWMIALFGKTYLGPAEDYVLYGAVGEKPIAGERDVYLVAFVLSTVPGPIVVAQVVASLRPHFGGLL